MQFYINLNLTIICTISISVLTISNKKSTQATTKFTPSGLYSQ